MTHRLSLRTRLVLIALATTLAILALTAWATSAYVATVMATMLNTKLDAQIDAFADGLDRSPASPPPRAAFLVEFARQDPHYGWRVVRGEEAWRGGARFGPVTPNRADPQEHEGMVTGIAVAATGEVLHVRTLAAAGARIEVAAPESIIADSIATAMRNMVLAICALGLLIGCAAWVLLSAALRPVEQLRDDVSHIRSGDRNRVSENQPVELAPLAREVNALLAQNQAVLTAARRHVANLAHGLKTPLATLSLRLRRERTSDETRALVAELDGRIEHHLRRARVAAVAVGGRAQTDVAAVAAPLVRAFDHLYPDRRIELAIDAEMVAAVESQDLDEMLGNLVDNACRHARSRVRLSCRARGTGSECAVEDDGSGIADDRIADAIASGTRLDQTEKGFGFGLSICHELVELYGGTLRLDRSPELGGLRARLDLPRQ